MILTRRLFRVVAPIVHVPISMFAAAAAVGVPAVGVIVVVATTVVVGRPMLGSLSLLCILPPAGFVERSNLPPEIVAGCTGTAEVLVLNIIFPISIFVPVSDPNRFSIEIHSKLLLNFKIRSSFPDHPPDVIC